MRVLFLDDNQNRCKRFRMTVPYATIVNTAEETSGQLKHQWDIVFLDHDLGGEIFVDSDNLNTGMEVVRWIEENKPKVTKFVVHSINTPAAKNMMARLLDMGYEVDRLPFINLWSTGYMGSLFK